MSERLWNVASVGRREVNNPGSTAEIFGVRRHRLRQYWKTAGFLRGLASFRADFLEINHKNWIMISILSHPCGAGSRGQSANQLYVHR